jgi:hypothetical protein
LKMGTDPLASKRKPWMPASVQKRYKQLVFKIIKAEELPRMDLGGLVGNYGTGDPYIIINHMGQAMRTSTKKMELIKPTKKDENGKDMKESFKPVTWNQ